MQYNHQSGTGAGNWETLTRPTWLPGRMPAEGVYTSRNEAYRQIKLRAKKVGALESSYRVVPEGTKGGAEMDRGYYRGQFWNTTTKAWQGTADVVGYRTAEECRRSISSKIGLTYRVKWYSNVA